MNPAKPNRTDYKVLQDFRFLKKGQILQKSQGGDFYATDLSQWGKKEFRLTLDEVLRNYAVFEDLSLMNEHERIADYLNREAKFSNHLDEDELVNLVGREIVDNGVTEELSEEAKMDLSKDL